LSSSSASRCFASAAGAARFAFGVVDNLSEPLLPALLAVLRSYLGARELRLRVDRSRTLPRASVGASSMRRW
jgi:hypothetical protein